MGRRKKTEDDARYEQFEQDMDRRLGIDNDETDFFDDDEQQDDDCYTQEEIDDILDMMYPDEDIDRDENPAFDWDD